jgi:hypothetical protein
VIPAAHFCLAYKSTFDLLKSIERIEQILILYYSDTQIILLFLAHKFPPARCRKRSCLGRNASPLSTKTPLNANMLECKYIILMLHDFVDAGVDA